MPRTLIVALLASFLSACASPVSGPAAGTESNYPGWVLNPDKPGYYSVVGSAPVQKWGGREAQFRVAQMKVRQEMAQMVRVQVESSSMYQTELRNGKVSNTADTETRLQSSVDLILEQARVIEEWTDPKTGMLYIWSVTPK